MARHEADREDLLREATALVQRAELRLLGWPESVVIGFRANGAPSVFFGGDPVYQFASGGELRRAFVDGIMLKAEQGRLVALRKQRSTDEVALVRQPLTAEEEQSCLAQLAQHLAQLHGALAAPGFHVLGQVPDDADIVSRTRDWLAQLPRTLRIASSPRVS